MRFNGSGGHHDVFFVIFENQFRQTFNFDSKKTKKSQENLQADAIAATKDLIDAVALICPMDVHNYDTVVRISFSAYNQIRNYFVLARSTSFQVEMLSTEMRFVPVFQSVVGVDVLSMHLSIFSHFTLYHRSSSKLFCFFFFKKKNILFSPLHFCTILLCFPFFFLLFCLILYLRWNEMHKYKSLECISGITKSRLPGNITSIRFTSANIWNGSNIAWCSSNNHSGRTKYRFTCDSGIAFISSIIGYFASNISAFW